MLSVKMIRNEIENRDNKSDHFEEAKEELNKKIHDDSDALESVLRHAGEMGRYQKWLFVAMAPFGFVFAFVYFVQMFVAATPRDHWCRVPELEHLDQELRHAGEMGRYQKWLFVAMPPFGFIFAFVYFVQMFVAATPRDQWCRVPELEHLDQELRWNLTVPILDTGEFEKCKTYDTNWTEVLLTNQPPHPNTSQVDCPHGWEFKLGDIPYHTVVSERGWVCQSSGFAPIAQSVFFAGSFAGGLLFGWLADRFGRVPALVGANLIGCAGGVASIFTVGLWDFAFCRFLVGMSYDSCFMMIYILVLEYVGPRHRTWVANMSIAIYFGGGCLILPWLAVWIGDWRRLILATSLPMLVVLAAPFIVPESARWLSSRGRVKQAVEVLRRFERVNRTHIPHDVMDEFIVASRQTRQTDESMRALFKSPELRTMMCFMVVVYMACAVIFDGLVRMSENLGLDFFITFTLTSATEIPSVTLLALVLDRWGRRMLTCGPMTIAGVLSLIAAFVPKGIPQVALAIMARFCINMSYNAAIQWATELLPTGVRASGSSVVHVSGYIATVVSPFIVYSERYWRSLPLLILGITGLFAATIGVLLPETRGRPMPQTIADGERLVREYSLCGKPEKDTPSEEWKNDKENSLIT